MPELPEVETIVRQLRRRIVGRTIASVRVLWPRAVEGSAREFRRRLQGMVIARVSRRGKYIGVEGEDGMFFTIHLRMTGKLVGELPGAERKHLRAQFSLADGTRLHYVDARKFGRLRLWPCRRGSCPGLGPEPLRDSTVLSALRGLRTRRPIKAVLLDQSVLAGIGNIYADEALYASRIHPLIPAIALNAGQQQRLAGAIPGILKAAIGRRGTTLRNYRTVAGENGENLEHLNVYGRAGLPCFSCGTPIEKIRISGRSAHFCPRCQQQATNPKGKSRGSKFEVRGSRL